MSFRYEDNIQEPVKVIGSFAHDKNEDFKDSMRHLMESFRSQYNLDPISDIGRILGVETIKESYKEGLLGDVMSESLDNDFYAMMPDKLEQLFENTGLEMLLESGVAPLSPIVGVSLPVLKKSYIEGHSKDIVMTEVPTKPIIKAAFERRFLKDKDQNKYYIPEVFYSEKYKEIMNKGRGKEINNEWYPKNAEKVPFQDLNILAESGGSLQNRDSLAMDFCVQAVKIEVDDELQTISLNVQPDMAANSSFTYRVKTKNKAGQNVEDILMGQVDFYNGTVSVGCSKGLIQKVQFGGHLSNENNYESIELDRERELIEWKIPDGRRINTGLTIEKIKDYKALFDLDITTEIISDMSTVLTQAEDSDILNFLKESYEKWKNAPTLPFGYGEFEDSFTAQAVFSCEPTTNTFVTRSQWINTELKYDFNRFIDELKIKLRNQDIMFVVYGHPNNVTLIQDDVRWVIDDNTKIGGIQLDYKFGVLTANKNRIHVISTLKCPKEYGLRAIAYPLTKEIITYKHYKYSMNIENVYRNPHSPLIPNVMGTSRYLTTEVLPVQGEFRIVDNLFSLRDPNSTATAQIVKPSVDIAAGTYTGEQLVTLRCNTPGVDIYWTVDGTDPLAKKENKVSNNGTVTIKSSCTLKAVACKTGMIDSAVLEVEYTINGG